MPVQDVAMLKHKPVVTVVLDGWLGIHIAVLSHAQNVE